MARGLKTRGMQELRTLRQRVIRQHLLERISKRDKEYLLDLLNQFEARVVSMHEDDPEYEKEL